jgi:small subunit ribosomal protein S2
MSQSTMVQLLEAGAHYGHRTNSWNPKMAPYIYGTRNKIHIIDLGQTAPMLENALQALKQVAAQGGRILFVGTKPQASEAVAEAAQRCGQYFVNHRWLGGMMTNWNTVSASIKTLENREKMLADEESGFTKKEILDLSRKRDKLEMVLGGIRNMGGMPNMLFVIDARREHLAIKEANKLGIPVVSIVDTNSSPEGVDYLVPANDDARKAISLYCEMAADAILEGLQESLLHDGKDADEEKPRAKRPAAKRTVAAKAVKEEEAEKPKAAKPAAKKAPADAETKAKPAAKKAEEKAEAAPADEKKSAAEQA